MSEETPDTVNGHDTYFDEATLVTRCRGCDAWKSQGGLGTGFLGMKCGPADLPEPIPGAEGRICFECKHCKFNSGWAGTDITPGDPLEVTCRKDVWSGGDIDSGGMYEDLRQRAAITIRRAETCEHFEPEEWAR